MNSDEIKKEIDLISQQIKTYAPQFAPFFDLDMTLSDYSKQLYDFPASSIHIKRQELIRAKIEEKLKKLLGEGFKDINFSLNAKLALNIVDHQMIMSHPFLASCNMVSSLNKLTNANKPDPIIVLSSSDVPPNNFFSKNGFLFYDKKIPLFSVSEREHIFYYLPKRQFNFVDRLKETQRWDSFNDQEKSFLIEHQKFINNLDFSRCRDYCDQITMIVKEMWPLLFESPLRSNLPDLLYITQEELVTECLIELLEDDDNLVSKSLFDQEFRNSILENFRGIVVTWREDEKKGTHFFWRKYPGQPRTIRMYLEGNLLVPQDERYKHLAVPMEKKAIIEMLKSREISPSLFTIFSFISFYVGLKPLTGFGSAVYLEMMKQAWVKTLTEHQMSEELELVKMVKTDGMVTLMVCFKRITGRVRAAYAHELIEQGGFTKDYLDKLLSTKFADALRAGVPDMYDYFSNKYIPAEVKIKQTVTLDDVSNLVFGWV